MKQISAFFVLLILGAASSSLAFQEPKQNRLPSFDKRPVQVEAAVLQKKATGLQHLKEQLADVQVDFGERLGAPKLISRTTGLLSGPNGKGGGISEKVAAGFAAADPHRVTKAFIKEHRDLLGHGPEVLENATIQREFVTAHNGMKTTIWQQELDGVSLFEALFISHVTKNEELVNISSQFIAEPAKAANPGGLNSADSTATPKINAQQAVALGAANVGEKFNWQDVKSVGQPLGAEKRQQFRAPGLKGEGDGRLVWLPENENILRLCWEITFTSEIEGEMFRVLVDAQTGDIWVRQSLTTYISNASYRVFTSDSPSPFSPGYATPLTNQPPLVNRLLVVTNAVNTNASPNGWIDDGGNQTTGNNVDAHLDTNNDDVADPGSRPTGSPARVFDFAMDLTQAPSTYTNASVVQLFYWCNWMHDKLYELGFTEAAGNFQVNNFGRGGLGNDPLQADGQDGGGFNNANMSTPSDGSSPRMQMYIFSNPIPNRDGDLDAEVILHEYTHGLSNRRIGGGVGLSALQSTGMGEGWSDFYGLALLSESGDNVNGNYGAGAYLSYQLSTGFLQNYYYGIRRYPYSTDLTKNPLTFKDIDSAQASSHSGIPISVNGGGSASEVHNQGEVWCVALWEARAGLINKYGFATGNQLILRLVTDGMNLSPANPTFLQARDGIIQADLVDNGGANRIELWTAFAKRGMGANATSPASSTTTGVRESFDLPDDLQISPMDGFTATGPVGGPFNLSSLQLTFTNVSSSNLVWKAAASSTWLTLSSSNGTLLTAQSAIVTVSLNSLAYSLPMGIYTNTVRFTNQTSGIVQSRQFILLSGQPDYFTELFSTADNDLDFQTFTFTPDGSGSYYSVCRAAATNFPTDPSSGTILSLPDDGYAQVTVSSNVSLYGTSSNTFFVGSNGYITFGSGDSSLSSTFTTHFSRLRISALLEDLYPSSNVSWKQMSNRVAVTYQDVREFGYANTNSFQIEMFFNGTIRLTYLRIDAQGGLVGLSQGTGLPIGFVEDDFSNFTQCNALLPLSVIIPPFAFETNGLMASAGRVNLPAITATNIAVNLSSSDTSEVTVPASVTVPAGASNVVFGITIIDDGELDGSQTATVTASATNYANATASITVYDSETATLGVVLPASTTEGAGIIQGVVTVSAAPVANVSVQLLSSDTTEIQTPAFVTIPAGQTSAVFNVTVVDDTQIDGTQNATITASVTNWTSGSANIAVLDNELTNLTVTVPGQATEGDGILTNAGRVRISGTWPVNLTVMLDSSDLTELTVPQSVTILAGQTSAVFNITVIDDVELDGQQTVTVTASAGGFTNGVTSMVVYDNESPAPPTGPTPPHLATNVIASIDLAWLSGETTPKTNVYDVYFGTNATPGVAEFQGNTTNTTWPLPTLMPLTTYYWQIISRRVGQTAGPVWRFTTRGVDHFEWSPIASPQIVNSSFPVSVTAKDEFNTTVSNFTETVNLSGFSGNIATPLFSDDFEDGDFAGWANGSGIYTRAVTNQTAAGGNYSFTLIGGTGNHGDGISHSLSNITPTNVTFYVRTSATNVSGGYFVIGTNIVSNTDVVAWFYMKSDGTMGIYEDATGWHGVPYGSNQWYRISLDLNWLTHRLNYSVDGSMAFTNIPFRGPTISNLTVVYLYNYQSTQSWWDEIQFNGGSSPAPINISPTNSANFAGGTWTGGVTIQELKDNVRLQASDSVGHSGLSNPFNLALTNDLSISLTDSPDPVLAGANLAYTLTVNNTGPSASTGVFLTNYLPSNVSVSSIASSQGTFTNLGSIVIFDLGTIGGGTTVSATIVVNASAAGIITNRAVVWRSEPEPYLTNNSASVVTSVILPSVSVTDVTVTETDLGTTTNAVFNVRLSVPAGQLLSVGFATANSSAAAGLDYVSTNGTLIFSPGETNQTVSVTVLGDLLDEPTELFFLNLSNVTNAIIAKSQGIGTILDNDPTPTLSINDVSVLEGNSGTNSAVFTVSLSAPSGQSVNVTYSTASGTATAGTDYASTSGSLSFTPGQTNRTIAVTVYGDTTNETDETFYLNLSGAVNATIADSQGVGTILDDDPSAIRSAGIAVTGESCTPGNGAIDPGETVMLSLSLTNRGSNPTTNLVVTLLANEAVISPSAANSYGVLMAGGVAITNSFTFLANGPCGGSLTARFQLQDGSNNLGIISFDFMLGLSSTNSANWAFTNTAPIVIPSFGVASPYPSVLNVTGVVGPVRKATVTLNNFTHQYPDNVDIMLVSPTGQKVMLLSDAGGSYVVTNVNLTFDDAASNFVPDSTLIVSGVYRPSDYEVGETLPSPAPSGPYGTALAAFTNGNPNGPWSLYVYDDTTSYTGSLSGWTLNLQTAVPECCLDNSAADLALTMTDSPHPITFGTNLTYALNVNNAGPATATGVVITNLLPPTVGFLSAISSQGTCSNVNGSVICSLGTLNAGSMAAITITVTPLQLGTISNTATVTANEFDFNNQNNNVSATTFVRGGFGGRVAIYAAPSTDSWTNDVLAKVRATGLFSTVDSFLVKSGYPVPTLAQLQQYDSVLVYSDSQFNDYTALGNVLADYADAGGGVVLATFSYNTGTLAGRFVTAGYMPFTTSSQSSGTVLTMVKDLASHPILDGVSQFNGGSSSFHNSSITTISNTVLVAHWSDNQPLVGAKDLAKGRVVGLNFYPPSSDARTDFWLASTDGGKLMANALTWAGASSAVPNDLVVSMTDSPDPVATGANLTYTITVTNTGPNAATSVILTNLLLTNANLLSVSVSQGSYSNDGGSMRFDLGTIPGGTNARATIIVQPLSIGLVTNVAGISRAEIDSNPANNISSVTTAVVTPSLSITDVSLNEGNTGRSTNALITVSLTPPSAQVVTVNFTTVDGTAVSSADYISTNGTLVFNPGETNKTIAVTIVGDSLNEANEIFSVNLSGATNANISHSQGIITIVDDDPLPLVYIDDASMSEGNIGTNNLMAFTVRLSAPSGRTSSVFYSNSSGTATLGTDFASTNGTITFNPGETNKTAYVRVYGDNLVEADETFYVTLSNALNLGYGDSQAIGTILDDDNILTSGDRLVWNSIPSPQQTNTPFPVTISARDTFNNLKTSFTGKVNLTAFNYNATATNHILEDNLDSSSANFGSFTVGYSFTPTNNLLVTHVRHFAGTKISIWTDTGVLLLSQNVNSSLGTWTETALSAPLSLTAGTRYRVAAFTGGAAYYWQTNGTASFVDGTIDGGFDTSGDAFPTNSNSIHWFMVDLCYTTGTSTPVAISPTLSGNFTSGAWTGNILVQSMASNVLLQAQSGVIFGNSNPFRVSDACPAPVAATSPVPANGLTNVSSNPVLSWTTGGTISSNCPVTYDVYFGTSAPFLNLVASGIPGTSFTTGDLPFNTTYYWQIIANRAGVQTPGPLWNFRTRPQPTVHHFAWNSITSPQNVDVPFNVTVTAQDSLNTTVTNFNGSATFSGSAGGITSITNFILGSIGWVNSNSGNFTLGYSFTPSSNLTVTHVRHYAGTKVSIWTDTGTLLVSQNVTSTPGTWLETPLATPVTLSAGTRYRVACYTGNSTYYWRTDGITNFAYGTIDQGYESSGDLFPSASDSVKWWFVDLRYTVGSGISVPITPIAGTFSNGIWTSNLAVGQAASNVVLRANDAGGHTGSSLPFNVLLQNDIGITMTDAPDPVTVGASLTNTIVVNNTGPSTATGVIVTNLLSPNVSLSSVFTPQGTYFVTNGAVVFNLGSVGSAVNLSLSVVSTPTVAGLLTNVAMVSRNEADATLANNSATTTTLAVNVSSGIFDDFEPGIDSAQWAAFGGTVLATNYGGYVSPVNSLWFGGDGQRFATTRAVNSSSGGTIGFYLRIANGASSPWEMADLPGEGIVLEYTVNSGATWVVLGTYDTSFYTSWTSIQLPIPVGAQSTATQFRWRQLANSGLGYDNWAIDDVQISTATPSPVAPYISTQPVSRTVAAGATTTFTVSAGGTSPLYYQWRFNGGNLAGATGSSLTLTNVSTNNVGDYSVMVSNTVSSVTSSNATLSLQIFTGINVLLIWDVNGSNTMALKAALETAGFNVTLSATSETLYDGTNPSPNSFNAVIRLNGTTFGTDMPLAGQNALVNFVQTGGGYVQGEWDAYQYSNGNLASMRDLILSDRYSGSSGLVTLSVVSGQSSHPVLTNIPSSFSFYAGFNVGGAHTFATNPVTVLMRDSQTNDAVLVRNFGSGRIVGFHHTGNYDSTLNTLADANVQQLYVNAVRWSSANVNTAPQITTQPQSVVAQAGSNAVFSVTATGTSPLLYQWKLDGSSLSGATASTLTLTNVTTNQAGLYSVTISNLYGSILSSNAQLTVISNGNLSALILWDTITTNTSSLKAALERQGINVMLASDSAYDGSNPNPNGFTAVIHLAGQVSNADIPITGQNALVSYVQNGGTYVGTSEDVQRWAGGRQAQMRELILLNEAGSYGGGIIVNPVSGQTSHPMLTNLSFPLSYPASGTMGPAHLFATNPVTVLMRDQLTNDAVVVRLVGNGRVVGFNHVGNDAYNFAVLQTNVQQLYINAVRWKTGLDHFSWASIPDLQEINQPFPVTIAARDALNNSVTNFSGIVNLSVATSGAISPALSGNFSNGLWTGFISAQALSSNVIMRADDSFGHSGLANPFAVLAPFSRPLALSFSGSNLVVSWPAPVANYVLEATVTLSPPNWIPVTNIVVLDSNRAILTNGVPTTNKFYRLRRN